MSYSIVFQQRTARWEVIAFDPLAVEPEMAAPEGDGQFNELNPLHTRVSWFVDPDGVMHMSERGMGHGDMPEFQDLMNRNFPVIQRGGHVRTPLAVGEFHGGNLLTHASSYPQHEIEPHIIELYNQRRAADPNLPQYTGHHDFTTNMSPQATMPADPNPFPKMHLFGAQELLDPADVDAVMQAAQVKPEIVDPTGQSWVWDPSSHTYTRAVPQHQTDRSHAWGGDAELFDPATQTEKDMNPLDEGLMHMGVNWDRGDTDDLAKAVDWEDGPGIYGQMDVDPEDRRTWSQTCPNCGQRESVFPSWHGPLPQHALTTCRNCGTRLNMQDMRPDVEQHELGPEPHTMLHDTPGQIDTMLKHAEVPAQYPAWGEPHCDNCKEGLPQWRDVKEGEPHLCEKCENNPAVLEDLRRQFRREPPQENHRTGPFPERVPKPNPYKQDNTFGTLPTTTSKSDTAESVNSREQPIMPEFRHIAEELAWRDANGVAAGDATLDACPQCGDPAMVDDHQGHKVCTMCGHRQPIMEMAAPHQMGQMPLMHGTVQKTALCPPLAALAAPLVEGLGAETAGAALGSAARAGVGALTDTGLKGFVARHYAMKGLEGAGNDIGGAVDNAANALNPASVDTAAPTDDSAMYAHTSSDDDDDRGGGVGAGDEGHDEDPDAGNQHFEQMEGDSPDLMKDTDMLGPGQGLSDEQKEALGHLEGCGKLVAMFVMSPESGRDSPLFSELEKMLRGAFKGHGGFEQAFNAHSGEGDSDGDGDHFEESVEKLKDDPNGDADSSDHPADPNEAAEVEERRHDNESSKESRMVFCARCLTPVYGFGGCPRCGSNMHVAMLPGQMPPASNINASPMQGQPMQQALDHNATNCPVCGGTGGAHNPGCTAQPVAPQLQQGQMGAYAHTASTHEAKPHPEGCTCNFPVCVRKREENSGDVEPAEETDDDWHTSAEHDHTRVEDHSHLFENSPDEPGAPAHDITVNSNLWVDSSGQPLQKDATYLLKSPNYTIPDKITVEQVEGDKLRVLVHTRYLSYENTLTPKQVTAESLSFEPVGTGDAGVGLNPSLEQNNDDNTAAESAGMDSSDTYTPVSHITPAMKQLYPHRTWLWDDAQPMDKTAAKDYTPREQRQFVDEDGTARNLDRLDLVGTHYVDSPDFDSHFNWGV